MYSTAPRTPGTVGANTMLLSWRHCPTVPQLAPGGASNPPPNASAGACIPPQGSDRALGVLAEAPYADRLAFLGDGDRQVPEQWHIHESMHGLQQILAHAFSCCSSDSSTGSYSSLNPRASTAISHIDNRAPVLPIFTACSPATHQNKQNAKRRKTISYPMVGPSRVRVDQNRAVVPHRVVGLPHQHQHQHQHQPHRIV